MSKLSTIVDGILDLADKILPALEGTPVPAIVAAGKAAIDLIDKARDVASDTDQARLSAKRNELEPRVMAHLDKTIASLG
jgi:hypothetical protein